MIKALEDDLLAFALREYKLACDRWEDKQRSDDYAYTNGSMPAYTARIEHWGQLVATISSNYGVEAPALFTRYKPYTPAELSTISKTCEAGADTATMMVHDYEDLFPGEKTKPQLAHYQYLVANCKTHKRMANFYAYLCNRPHPFAGIDMLPANIG